MALTSLLGTVELESVIPPQEREGARVVRKIGPPCTCGCFERVGQSKVEDIFHAFWAITDHKEQNAYISKQVLVLNVKRRRVKNRPSRRQKTRKYRVSWDREIYQVCSKAFRSMHGISERRVRSVLQKVTNEAPDVQNDWRQRLDMACNMWKQQEEDSSDYDDTSSGQGEASGLPNIDIVKEEIEDLEEDVVGEELKQLMRETGVQEKKIDSMKEQVVVYPFSNSAINTSKSRKRKKTPDNELDQQPLVSSVTELCNRLSASEKGDEFHQFGLNVAAQLRAMTLPAALEAQLDIQKILTTKRFEFLET
ncbi:hypothetical protein Pcinc_023231 [Petrolisthes cinctipes]|uniref:Uncharacterized protein n=1 Tax=Petrolisthes cinctipes TaxID=88211 RepID=A0AAE1KES5_PETCI|nr:hypothetical protein Pcinc_023231 [Petrolisthes cinctipes]